MVEIKFESPRKDMSVAANTFPPRQDTPKDKSMEAPAIDQPAVQADKAPGRVAPAPKS